MKLYEIPSEIEKALESAVNHETGEIDSELLSGKLNELESELERKALNIACLIKNMRAEATALKTESDRLLSRAKTANNRADYLEGYLAKYLTPSVKYSDERAVISWRPSTRVEISCPYEELPIEFQKSKTEITADKEMLKVAISGGKEIKGVTIKHYNNINIK